MLENEEQTSATPTEGTEATGNRDGECAVVKEWLAKVKSAKKHYEKDFKRMDTCMDIAALGAKQEWIDDDNYVVPILVRHINQSVSQLYAKNPKASVKRKKRLLNTVWDGTLASLELAQATMQSAVTEDAADPNVARQAELVMKDAQQVKAYNMMLDRTAQTMELLFEHYIGEQEFNYKQQLKALVRRTKTVGVGYIKLGYQRIMEPSPEITARISDVTSQIAEVEQLIKEVEDGKGTDLEATKEKLSTTLKSLQSQEALVLREGPVLDFPRHDAVIIDPECSHLKSLAGANWVDYEYRLSSRDIQKIFGVDVEQGRDVDARVEDDDDLVDMIYDAPTKHSVHEVWDKESRQCFTVCEGHKYYLKPPAEPDVYVEKFFNLFPLVFNEIEHKKKLYPNSDVWNARHTQMEYNRNRESLREHRIANRPYYIASSAIEDEELDKLAEHDAHEVIQLTQLQIGQKAEDILQRGPTAPIDPNLYEVEMLFTDMLRTVGAQEANMGGTSNSTATESSIAEQSRSTAQSDHVDDLDDVLSNVSKAMGHLMLVELPKETVQEIVGPGAVWPEIPATREEIAKDLSLEVKAGSSGRPNRAADLANLERAIPYVMQIPGMRPEPLLRRYLDLLDIDAEEAISAGLPSITAMNTREGQSGGLGGAQGAAPTGNAATDPNAQGGAGGQNTAATQAAQPGPQPAYPSG